MKDLRGPIAGLVVVAVIIGLATELLPSKKEADQSDLQHALQNVSEAMRDPKRVALMECNGVKVYEDPQPPGHPPSAEECQRLQAEANGQPPGGAVRYTNQDDAEYCNRSEVIERMKDSMNVQIDADWRRRDLSLSSKESEETERVLDLQDVGAGQNFCESNVPDACKAEPQPGKHVCHATLSLRDGRLVPGTFFIDEANWRFITFMSDEKRRANGM